jgi:pyruvate dehydrogenase E2 component (dihydrolipoamide acetyltransferase)
MAFSVVMPALEMAQETGKLLAWRKKEGDRVTKGEPLLEIETDKAVVEVEAPADGILAGIKAAEGADIPVGQTIAWIVSPGEAIPAETESTAPAARAGSHAKPEASHAAVTEPAAAPTPGARISPKARRLAKELGIDIATVRGSGRVEKFSHRMCRPPQLPHRVQLRNNLERSKYPARSAASWPSARRRAGRRSLTSS